MSKETEKSSSNKRSNNEEGFTDPGRKPWVWLVLAILLAGVLPIWPVTGSILGFPSWAVLAVFFSFLTSVFILYVILFVWRDPDEHEGSK